MSSNDINNEWKDQLIFIRDEYNKNIYDLLRSVKKIIENNYENEKNYKKKKKLIINTWYCDSLKEYIFFLEKTLSQTIKKLERAENGFDERNKNFNLNYLK